MCLYLQDPPSVDELAEVLILLGMKPRDLMRKKEAEYKALDLADDSKTDAELLQAMVENPRLIERPVVLAKGKAALGRPPESVLDIL